MIEFWIDPESPYHKDVFAQEGKKYVFHCASGWRSALTVATLQDMGFEAAHLKEGFSTWEKQGGPVEQQDSGDKNSSMKPSAFENPGKFWRGNLHTHSNLSDGILEPEEVCRRYFTLN